MQKSKILLIGYRACGKSCIGNALADKISYNFMDMDQVIEEREGCSIQDMVAAKGWKYFRTKEELLLKEIITMQESLVVSTGGGAIIHQNIWPEIMKTAFIVWLSADPDTICQRILSDKKTTSQRPSLTGKDVLDEVRDILAEREPLYKKGSNLIIDTGSMDIETAVQTIKKNLIKTA